MSGIEVPSSSSSSVEEFNITASSPDKDGKVKVNGKLHSWRDLWRDILF